MAPRSTIEPTTPVESRLAVCTVFYLSDLGLLSKNRDKEVPEREEIVRTNEFTAIRTRGADYFSLGLNRHGCCFVSTAVNDPAWTAAVEQGHAEEARRIWKQETEGRESPTKLVSSLVSEVKSVGDWLDAIGEQNLDWRGYNVIMTDGKRGVHVEFHSRNVVARDLDGRDVITNHFRAVEYGPRGREDYANSFDRFDYARAKARSVTDAESLFVAIHPDDMHDRERIWRDDCFRTVSSSVIDFRNGRLYYTDSIDSPFEALPEFGQ